MMSLKGACCRLEWNVWIFLSMDWTGWELWFEVAYVGFSAQLALDQFLTLCNK